MNKISNTESFIKRASEIHNNFYSYEHTEYKGSYENVNITCPIHGIFEQNPNNHLQGNGCKKCTVGDRRAKVLEKFIGETFNYLTVIGLVKGAYKSNGKAAKRTYFKCQCVCGKIKNISPGEVRNNKTKSCGCKMGDLFRLSYELSYGKKHSNPVITMLWSEYKGREGREFSLTFEEFKTLVKSPCFYCGEPPSNLRSTKHLRRQELVGGIDRVNNNLGYVTGNCVPCCKICNFMKRSSTLEDFMNHIQKIYNFNFVK